MSTELERYKEAVEYLIKEMVRMHKLSGDRVRNDVEKILNPPPVYEEVTVERWECQKCGRVHMGTICVSVPCGYNGCNGTDYKPLPFTRRVPVAQKVARSVSVEGVQISDLGMIRFGFSDRIQFKEAAGKTVTLTATWEE